MTNYSILFSALLLMPCFAHAQGEFLEQSEALRNSGITLLNVHSTPATDWVAVSVTAPDLDGKKKFLIGDQAALVELTGQSSAGNVAAESCGTPIKLSKLTPVKGPLSKRQWLVAVGDRVQEVLHWFPATESALPLKSVCPSRKAGFKAEKARLFSSSGIAEKVTVSRWLAIPSTAPVDPEACPIRSMETTAFLGKNQCVEFNALPQDCDGTGRGASMEALLGVLQIGTEKWLIFSSSGYESTGYSAVRYMGPARVDQKTVHENHFEGC